MTRICYACRSEVDLRASVCPNCRTKLGRVGKDGLTTKPTHFAVGCLAAFLGLGMAATCYGVFMWNGPSRPAPSPANSNPASPISETTIPLSANEKAVMRYWAKEDFDSWSKDSKDSKLNIVNPADAPSIVRVSADLLQNIYSANEVNADLKYKDKDLLVTGVVTSIDRSVGSNYFLKLKGGDNMFMSPHAKMADGFVDYLAGLKKGQSVTLFGKCDGMLMGSVSLSQCVPSETWAESYAKDYVEKYIQILPAIIKNKNMDGLKLGVKSTTCSSLLSSPNAFDEQIVNVGKADEFIDLAVSAWVIIDLTRTDSSWVNNGYKKYKVDNKTDLFEAYLNDLFLKDSRLKHELMRTNLKPVLLIKDSQGNETPVFDEACKKYGLNPAEIKSLQSYRR